MQKQDNASSQQSIERTVTLINHLASTLEPMSITEISNFLGISRSTAYAMLNVLTKHNYLYRDKATKKYFLGYRLFILGGLTRYRYRDLLICDEYLRNFVSQTPLSINLVSLATLEPDYQIAHILTKTPNSAINGSYNGSFNWHRRLHPAYCAACGKVLLSELSKKEQEAALQAQELKKYTDATIVDPEVILQQIADAGKQGYCIDIEGYSNFEVNIAAPIRNQAGKVVAALNVSVSTLIYKNRMHDYIQLTTALAREISSIIGYGRFPG